MARLSLTARLGLAGSIIAVGLVASSCSNGAALSNGRTACHYVDVSLKTLRSIPATASTAQRAATTKLAQSQLLEGLSYAAAATSDDGSYNALMTSIQEADRVPESYLEPSLEAICQVVNSSQPYLGS
jgi:hypothetical protein